MFNCLVLQMGKTNTESNMSMPVFKDFEAVWTQIVKITK